MKLVMIGAGQAANVLGRKMVNAGHTILQVFSRTEAHAASLAAVFSCAYTSLWDRIDKSADLYIAAISDRALPEMARALHLGNKIVVHTAGSVSKDILKPVSKNYGVLYPLQSLSIESKEIPVLPLLVDGNTEDTLTLITDFAGSISDQVKKTGDEQRLKLHLAAVIVNNFANHLYVLTESFCRREGVDFNLLLPIITETAGRLSQGSPAKFQTGPAIRQDQETIRHHLSILEKYPELVEVYKTLTRSIERFQK